MEVVVPYEYLFLKTLLPRQKGLLPRQKGLALANPNPYRHGHHKRDPETPPLQILDVL